MLTLVGAPSAARLSRPPGWAPTPAPASACPARANRTGGSLLTGWQVKAHCALQGGAAAKGDNNVRCAHLRFTQLMRQNRIAASSGDGASFLELGKQKKCIRDRERRQEIRNDVRKLGSTSLTPSSV